MLFSKTVFAGLSLLTLVKGEGLRSVRPRIVGGQPSSEPFPYFAHWNRGCGGSLVAEDIILTAAHCEPDLSFSYSMFWLGGLELGKGVSRSSMGRIPHPLYNEYDFSYDFMLVKLNTSALVDENNNPTGLSIVPINRESSNPAQNDPLLVMGFGDDWVKDGKILQEVIVPTITENECMDLYSEVFYDVDPTTMFCAGDIENGGKDTCQGKLLERISPNAMSYDSLLHGH